MTSATPAPSSTTPPGWPHCAHGATAEDPVGCRGRRIPDRTACLAHAAEPDRAAYLTALAPGADVDHRGTPFTTELLDRLLDALRDPATGHPRLGTARFDGAAFTSEARFSRAAFTGDAWFVGTSFVGVASFGGATFTSEARFGGASFTRGARFVGASFAGVARFGGASFTGGATFLGGSFASVAWFGGASFTGVVLFDDVSFSGVAWFDRASFTSDASFDAASFTGTAWFGGASFTHDVSFDAVTFMRDAQFRAARFEATARLGPLICGGRVVLDRAVFGEPVTVEAAAHAVTCDRTRWASTATLWLRHAELDLSDAVLEFPLTVTARRTPFPSLVDLLPETPLADRDPGVRLISVDGVDAAHLVLHDIDLSLCRFAGAIHLDQLRVDGWCTFATTPNGFRWRRFLRMWWSTRSTLAEEHHWRSQRSHRAAASGWTGLPHEDDTPPLELPALPALAALYRQLRKSLEDGKNEPDAADFYYGEMEMRRHAAKRFRGERALLTLYWALSGYGLRVGRALAWLLGAMTVTLLALLLWGLPVDDPKPTTTGRQVAVGQEVTLTTDTPDPVNPTGSCSERVTTERFEKGLRVVINSVVFRSSGQDLTTVGTYTEMFSRLAEPVLLGLAVLAIRSRVKR
ncbi:pentapeptide repeat-containing protein [Streptomyces xinghaiensis]|uniref:pentapeptide repeat-containing protein n=1 Tax=Streptomyces xinghaiensis TaxID=1038928 RepID=UPI0003135D5A|nr:pentapeptide repeat-containing protein [Streptomyces xinghaiensis]MZE80062.1 pentapeptide repeat-containing protein [Streptomyces sp. SID5475]